MSMKMSSIFFAAAILLGTLIPAQGAEPDTLLSLPDGQVVLAIAATERREVTQDLLVATFSCTASGGDTLNLQNEINTVMRKAVDIAKKYEKVRIATGSYHVYEYTDPRTKEKKWRGSQNLTVKGREAQSVLELAGRLQEAKMTIDGMTYTLDPQTAADLQDALMEEALQQLQTRAARAAKTLGKRTAELREVSVQGAGMPYPLPGGGVKMMLDAAAPRAAAAPPVAEAGDTAISLTVTARALLKP